MTRAEQPTVVTAPANPTYDEALAADSRERAVRALLRTPGLRRLWSAQLVSGIGDALALLVLVLLAYQAAVSEAAFGGGYRGAAFAVAVVFGVRILATLVFGAVLLGPLAALLAPGGKLDRRWTMVGADGIRLGLFVVAPLWLDWIPDHALTALLATVFVSGAAERLWSLAKDSAAPALLPTPPPEGATVRPLPDHLDALRPADPADLLRRAAGRRGRAARRDPGGQGPRPRRRLVRRQPGRPRLVRRRRTLRGLRLAAAPAGPAGYEDPAPAFPAGGPAGTEGGRPP